MKNSSIFVLWVLAVMGFSASWIGAANAAEPALSEAIFHVA
ncbi:MAG: hypothetical protein QNK29_00630 [Desulfobacterales bacterium]|nr:hypothetical protein [Desulfobacterales bacterium]MDX2510531.1 hypothetical protein [Desulfobacterales bacterium]